MSRLNTFAPVVRLVAHGYCPRPTVERVWCFAPGSRTATGPSLLPWLWSYRHLLVVNRQDPAAVKQGFVEVALTPSVEGDHRVGGVLQYTARCVEGEEKRLLEVLGTVPDAESEFHRQVQFWVAEWMRRGPGTDLEALKQDIVGDIQRRAHDELGLDVAATLTVSTEIKRMIELSFMVWTVPRDTPRERVPVRVELVLAPAARRGWTALLAQRRLDEIEDAVRDEVTHALATRRYHDLVLGTEEVLPTGLLDAVSGVAGDYGHVVRELRLTPEAAVAIPRTLAVQHSFEYTHRDARSAVTVRSDMLLDLEDAGGWVRAGRPNLDEWARRVVQEATKEVLFPIPYRAFLLGFETQRQAVRDRMEREAERVGYRIRVFHTVSGLQVDVLKESFRVRAGDDFSTRVAKVRAALDITVEARIPTPNDRVEQLLAQDAAVLEEMRKRINFVADAVLRRASPEEVYLHLDTLQATEAQEELGNPFAAKRGETLRARLERVVAAELASTFGAVVLQVSFAARGNPISDCLDRLCGKEHRFEVTVEIKGGKDILPFSGSLSVLGVDEAGWPDFVRLLPTIDDVRDTIGNFLRSRFADGKADELRGTVNQALEAFVERALGARLAEAYGLLVRVRDWRRHHTRDEAANQAEIGRLIEARTEESQSWLEHQLEGARDVRVRLAGERKSLLDERKRLQDELTRFFNELTEPRRAALRERMEEIDRQLKDGREGSPGALDAMLAERGAGSIGRSGELARPAAEGLSLQQLFPPK